MYSGTQHDLSHSRWALVIFDLTATPMCLTPELNHCSLYSLNLLSTSTPIIHRDLVRYQI